MDMGIAVRIHSERSCPVKVLFPGSFLYLRGVIDRSLTLVSIPISHPAMFRPASQTAFACATKAEAKIERSMVVS